MDELVFRQMLDEVSARSCPFAKTILTRGAGCSMAVKRNIAERELVVCNNQNSHERCVAFRDLLRNNFTFALGQLHIDGPLPHAKEMRMQCGGLIGLQFVLDGTDEIADIDELLMLAQQKFGALAGYPCSQIVQFANAHYKPR
ncbi:MAG: hypothetical protein NTY60_04880 [Proteobacteria bacterium]|nr:hypothetical protein [Pseudomonadota bacterium]